MAETDASTKLQRVISGRKETLITRGSRDRHTVSPNRQKEDIRDNLAETAFKVKGWTSAWFCCHGSARQKLQCFGNLISGVTPCHCFYVIF